MLQKASYLKLIKDSKEDLNGIEAYDYVIYLSSVRYETNGTCKAIHKAVPIEFALTSNKKKPLTKCIFVKCDKTSTYAIIATNSELKYYCQLFLISVHTGGGINIRPVYCVTPEDSLPEDNLGRTSMEIADMTWTSNGLFIVILFSNNFFCVMSRLGVQLRATVSPSWNPKNFITFSKLSDPISSAHSGSTNYQHISCLNVKIFHL